MQTLSKLDKKTAEKNEILKEINLDALVSSNDS